MLAINISAKLSEKFLDFFCISRYASLVTSPVDEKYLVVEGEDSDVSKERWIMNQDAETLSSKYIMKIKDLTRVFNSGIFKREEKIAVKRISVGIKKGEVGTRLA